MPIDNETFDRLKRACANPITGMPRCWYCEHDEGELGDNGKPIKLVKGHLISDNDGGPAVLENTAPICASCNGRIGANLTEDKRPPGWKSEYVKIVMADLGVGLVVATPPGPEIVGGDATCRNGENAENKKLIPLESVQFSPTEQVYKPPSSNGTRGREAFPTKREISVLEATTIANAFITRARKYSMTQPTDDTAKGRGDRSYIINVARKFGPECFAVACNAFLASVNENRPPEWHRFYKAADGWLSEGIDQLRRDAEIERRAKEPIPVLSAEERQKQEEEFARLRAARAAERAEKEKQREKEERQTRFFRILDGTIADCPDYAEWHQDERDDVYWAIRRHEENAATRLTQFQKNARAWRDMPEEELNEVKRKLLEEWRSQEL